MKKIFVFSVVFFLAIISAIGQDDCQSLEYSKVQVYDQIIAIFERSDVNKVCVLTDDDIDITTEDGTLRMRKIAGNKYEKQPRVHIYYKDITHIEGYAKADLSTNNLIQTDSLTITLNTGARFYADLDIKYLNANVVEGALLDANGYAVEQYITAGSNATFSGWELEGETAEVKATMGSKVKINIEKELSGTATTRGYISYKGSPQKDVKTSLGGKLVSIE